MNKSIKLENHYDLEELHQKLEDNSKSHVVIPEDKAAKLTKIASDAFFEAKASGLGVQAAYEIAKKKLQGV